MSFMDELRAGFSPATDHKNVGVAVFILGAGMGRINEELDVIPKNIRRAFR